MTHPDPSELLSAYLDDEVSVEERAAVEAWLAESEDGRRELDELRRLSAVLRQSLPSVPAPESVLEATRRTATPRRAASTGRAPESAPAMAAPAPRDPARRPATGATVVAVCAMLLVVGAVSLLLGPPRNEDDTSGGPASPALASADTAPGRTVATVEHDEASRESGAAEARPETKPETVREPGRGAGRVAMAAADDEADDPPGENLLAKNLPRMLLPRAEHSALVPGDVVPLEELQDGEVVVVEALVLDVRRAVGEVQVLLQRNKVRESRTEGANTRRKDAIPSNEPFAVYISASPERIQAAMQALERSREVVSVRRRADEEAAEHAEAFASRGLKEELEYAPDRGGRPSAAAFAKRSATKNPTDAAKRAFAGKTPANSYRLIGTLDEARHRDTKPGGRPSTLAEAKPAPLGPIRPGSLDDLQPDLSATKDARSVRMLLLLRPRPSRDE